MSEGTERVLIVDGQEDRRARTAEALAQAGFEVATAGTGERALMILRQWPRRIDWLVTGADLPGLVDGWMLADEFHQTHPTRPVLLASGGADRSLRTHAVVVDPAAPAAVVEALQTLAHGAPRGITAWAA